MPIRGKTRPPHPGTFIPPPGGRTVNQVAFSPDGRWLAGGGGQVDGPSWVVLWDMAALKRPPRIREVPKEPVAALAFSPAGDRLASSCVTDTKVQLWSVPTLDPLAALPLIAPGTRPFADGSPRVTMVGGLAFAPDGRTLAAGCWDMTVKLWNLKSKSPPLRELAPKHADNVDFVAYLGRGKQLLSGTSDELRVWDTGSGKLLRKLQLRGKGDTWSHALSPDATTLVSVADGGTVWIWDTATWKHRDAKLRIPCGVGSAAFTPGGKTVAIGMKSGGVLFFDVAEQAKSYEWRRPGSIQSLYYTPDGTTLALVEVNSDLRSALHLMPSDAGNTSRKPERAAPSR
jgi:WD40 repeat protein